MLIMGTLVTFSSSGWSAGVLVTLAMTILASLVAAAMEASCWDRYGDRDTDQHEER